MQPNTEKIIEITANLQQQARVATIELIHYGIKLSALHPMIEAFDSLDRVVQNLSEPHAHARSEFSPDNFHYWQERALKAEEALERQRQENASAREVVRVVNNVDDIGKAGDIYAEISREL